MKRIPGRSPGENTFPVDTANDTTYYYEPRGLPEGMTVDELRQDDHRSLPRNTLLAQVFYYGELLEKWGTGTSRMITLCQNHGIPEPEFSAHPDWFSVTFAKDFYADERLLARGLSNRQVQAVRYVREQGVITNKAYRELTGAIDRTALRDLNDLCTKGIFLKRDKKGRATEYVLVKKNPDINPSRCRYNSVIRSDGTTTTGVHDRVTPLHNHAHNVSFTISPPTRFSITKKKNRKIKCYKYLKTY